MPLRPRKRQASPADSTNRPPPKRRTEDDVVLQPSVTKTEYEEPQTTEAAIDPMPLDPQVSVTAALSAAPQPTVTKTECTEPQTTEVAIDPIPLDPQSSAIAALSAAPQPTVTETECTEPQTTEVAIDPIPLDPQSSAIAALSAAPQPTITETECKEPQTTEVAIEPLPIDSQPSVTAALSAAPQPSVTAALSAAPQPSVTAALSAAPQPTVTETEHEEPQTTNAAIDSQPLGHQHSFTETGDEVSQSVEAAVAAHLVALLISLHGTELEELLSQRTSALPVTSLSSMLETFGEVPPVIAVLAISLRQDLAGAMPGTQVQVQTRAENDVGRKIELPQIANDKYDFMTNILNINNYWSIVSVTLAYEFLRNIFTVSNYSTSLDSWDIFKHFLVISIDGELKDRIKNKFQTTKVESFFATLKIEQQFQPDNADKEEDSDLIRLVEAEFRGVVNNKFRAVFNEAMESTSHKETFTAITTAVYTIFESELFAELVEKLKSEPFRTGKMIAGLLGALVHEEVSESAVIKRSVQKIMEGLNTEISVQEELLRDLRNSIYDEVRGQKNSSTVDLISNMTGSLFEWLKMKISAFAANKFKKS